MRKQLLISLGLAVLTCAVYLQVRHFDFINLDDYFYVLNNPRIQQGFSLPSVTWALTAVYQGTWQPLVWFSYMLDFNLGGLDPGFFHLTNVVLHILNTLLLLAVLTRMTGSFWKSFFVSALFALHPLHVESVAWIAERKGLLSTLFLFLALWAYLGYTRRPSVPRYLLVLLAFSLGLMAKPMLVTFPVMLLLLDYWPLNRIKKITPAKGLNRIILWEKTPLFALSALSCLIAVFVQEKAGAVRSFEDFPLGLRIENAFVSYVSYIGKMFWPVDLAIFYQHPGYNISIPLVTASVIFLICVSALIARSRHRYPFLLTGWLWYIITLLPVIGLVQIGTHALADRFTYIPLIGIFIMISWGVPEFLSRYFGTGKKKFLTRFSPQRIQTFFAGITLGALTICTYFQIGYWRNNILIFAHTIDVTTNNDKAALYLGISLAEKNFLKEGIPLIQEAIKINPRNPAAYSYLAYAYEKAGQFEKASAIFKDLLLIEPDNPYYHAGYAGVLCHQKKFDLAISHQQTALRLDPENPFFSFKLADILLEKGAFPGAWREVHKAERRGLLPPASLLRDLSRKMPEPRE